MDSNSILERFGKLNVWRRGNERAPHKPLLVLLALGHLSNGEEEIPFSVCEQELSKLLREFGPSRTTVHPQYPFWRLQNDKLWEVSTTKKLYPRSSNTDPPISELRAGNAVGRFPEDIREKIQLSPKLLTEIAEQLLFSHFPDSIHEDILDAIGLSLDRTTSTRKHRDPRFRQRVMIAYEYRCAVCGLDLRIANITIALEAAHIRWHQAKGPDREDNGLALCSLHHKLFDLGTFTIHPNYRILVSESVHGTGQFNDVLLRYHGTQINCPSRPEHVPAAKHLGWHRREVFKEPPRFLQDDL